MEVQKFTFNAFQENTYVVYDNSKECLIFDPGCSNPNEESELAEFIEENGLTPVGLINTHCHIDHVLGNKFVSDRYALPLASHEGEKVVLSKQPEVAMMYGLPYTPSPEITVTYAGGDKVTFGSTSLDVIYAPGHSPAHICFFEAITQQLIAGDVLFHGSIGRTDLPGGNHELLLKNIKEKLYILPPKTVVFCGHGPNTTIEYEMKTNPFVRT